MAWLKASESLSISAKRLKKWRRGGSRRRQSQNYRGGRLFISCETAYQRSAAAAARRLAWRRLRRLAAAVAAAASSGLAAAKISAAAAGIGVSAAICLSPEKRRRKLKLGGGATLAASRSVMARLANGESCRGVKAAINSAAAKMAISVMAAAQRLSGGVTGGINRGSAAGGAAWRRHRQRICLRKSSANRENGSRKRQWRQLAGGRR